ncbi:PIN domain-containing protein [bacterium]|nr:PIN domain-containing protein [bacterium]MBU1614872.1 PIN domain-containing protein [bacterium]
MERYVIDTHALVWFLEKSRKLGKKVREILGTKERILIIPTIVLAEIKYLHKKHRFSTSLREVMEVIEEDKHCLVYPLDIKVVEVMPEGLDIHDGIIVATGLSLQELFDEEIKVLTKDGAIKDSGLISTVW